LAAKMADLEKLQLLINSCKNPDISKMSYSPLQLIYRHDDTYPWGKNYFACAEYLFKHTQFTQKEVANRLGITFNADKLSDKQIAALLRIDKALFNLNSASSLTLFGSTIVNDISNFITEDNLLDKSSIVIGLIESIFKKGGYDKEEVFNQFIPIKKTKLNDPKKRALFAKGMHYWQMSSSHLNSFALTCKALKCFREVANEDHLAAEDALQLYLPKSCLPDRSLEKLTLLGHFAITVATIARKKLSRGLLWWRSPETMACSLINPFIDEVNQLMKDTGNPDEKLEALRQLILSLPSSNLLHNAFNSYLTHDFFSSLIEVKVNHRKTFLL
ncbi:MAG: hypothetical protein ACYCQI_14005, partial [Gammaproteobacteria bacterium]